jgi:hypothetical protein
MEIALWEGILGSVAELRVRVDINRRDIKMTQSNARKLIGVNLAFWGVVVGGWGGGTAGDGRSKMEDGDARQESGVGKWRLILGGDFG